jgi:hypothetical protein
VVQRAGRASQSRAARSKAAELPFMPRRPQGIADRSILAEKGGSLDIQGHVRLGTIGLTIGPSSPASPRPPVSSTPWSSTATATTLYLMPSDHRRLRKLAIDRDVSMQTLILDAIDLLMVREGQGPVERWETRRKER